MVAPTIIESCQTKNVGADLPDGPARSAKCRDDSPCKSEGPAESHHVIARSRKATWQSASPAVLCTARPPLGDGKRTDCHVALLLAMTAVVGGRSGFAKPGWSSGCILRNGRCPFSTLGQRNPVGAIQESPADANGIGKMPHGTPAENGRVAANSPTDCRHRPLDSPTP